MHVQLDYQSIENILKNCTFVISKEFKCSDVYKFRELNSFCINIFEVIFYQEEKVCKNILVPIESNKNYLDKVVGLLIYKNHYVFIKKTRTFGRPQQIVQL